MVAKHRGEWGASNWDPGHRLSDPHINPAMRRSAEAAFHEAVAIGLHPRIGPQNGGYRDPQQADALHQAWVHHAPGAHQAAAGWHTAHNYGLALDIYLIDKGGGLVDRSRHPGDDYSLLIELLQRHGFTFGAAGHGDPNHFQYQPAMSHPIHGAEWVDLRDWAFGVAKASEHDRAAVQGADWLQFVWSAVGAGGHIPASGPNGPESGQVVPPHGHMQADATAAGHDTASNVSSQHGPEHVDLTGLHHAPDAAASLSAPHGPEAGWAGSEQYELDGGLGGAHPATDDIFNDMINDTY